MKDLLDLRKKKKRENYTLYKKTWNFEMFKKIDKMIKQTYLTKIELEKRENIYKKLSLKKKNKKNNNKYNSLLL